MSCTSMFVTAVVHDGAVLVEDRVMDEREVEVTHRARVRPAERAQEPRDPASSSGARSRAGRDGARASSAAPARAASARSRRGRPESRTSGTRAPRNSGGPRVLRALEQPRRERVVDRRRLVAEHAGEQAHDRVERRRARRARRPTARSRRSRAPRRRPRVTRSSTPFVAPADEEQRPTLRERRAACALVEARAARGEQDAPGRVRDGRSRSIAATSGSGFITMPWPPPYGTSSTTRCLSVV